MINVSVSIPPQLLTLQEDVTKTIRDNMTKAVNALKDDLRKESPVDEGDLRDGWNVTPARIVNTEVVCTLTNGTPAALYRVRGRGPGKPPPVKAVEGWARRRGLSPYLVARNIGRRGTARWRENENVMDIERTSTPDNIIPQRNGRLTQTAEKIAREINKFSR